MGCLLSNYHSRWQCPYGPTRSHSFQLLAADQRIETAGLGKDHAPSGSAEEEVTTSLEVENQSYLGVPTPRIQDHASPGGHE